MTKRCIFWASSFGFLSDFELRHSGFGRLDVFAKKARRRIAGFPEAISPLALGQVEPVDFADQQRPHGGPAEVGRFATCVKAPGVDG